MPELPEVETTRRGIEPHVLRQTIQDVIIRQRQLRWPISRGLKQSLINQTVLSVERRAKYLLLHFQNGVLLMHLGMSGCLRILPLHTPAQKHDHVDIVFKNQLLRFTDPRRFGAILWLTDSVDEHALLKHLGPEPLSDEFNADYLYAHSRGRKIAIKQYVMDSKVVVGIGNIYAQEALFSAGIHPETSAGIITLLQYKKLIKDLKRILQAAVLQGGTSLKDFLKVDGKPGYFRHELKVYARGGEPCVKCKMVLSVIRQGQRSTVYCEKCQT